MGSRRTFDARDLADVYDDDDFLNELTGARRGPERRRKPKRRQREETPDKRSALRRDQPSKPFKCRRCKAFIGAPVTGGRHRNHCPNCLCSLHVDLKTPGDRASPCRSLMEPVATAFHHNGEQVVVHHCLGCGITRHNRIAADDSPLLLMTLPLTALEELVVEHQRDVDRGESSVA